MLLLSSCKDKSDFETSGLFESDDVVVSAEGTGKLITFKASEGSKLKANELVGQIDSIQLSLEIDRNIAQIKELTSSLPDIAVLLSPLEERLSKAIFERDRNSRLVAAKSANQKQLDDANAEIDFIKKEIAAKKSELQKQTDKTLKAVDVLHAQNKILEDKIKKSKIVNPIDGTVLVKYAEPLELAQYGRPLYKIANLEKLFLRAYFTAGQVTKLKLSDKVKIRADFGNKEYRYYDGEVVWIADKSEFTPKGIRNREERVDLVYAVKIEVKNDGYLKIGQYAEVLK